MTGGALATGRALGGAAIALGAGLRTGDDGAAGRGAAAAGEDATGSESKGTLGTFAVLVAGGPGEGVGAGEIVAGFACAGSLSGTRAAITAIPRRGAQAGGDSDRDPHPLRAARGFARPCRPGGDRVGVARAGRNRLVVHVGLRRARSSLRVVRLRRRARLARGRPHGPPTLGQLRRGCLRAHGLRRDARPLRVHARRQRREALERAREIPHAREAPLAILRHAPEEDRLQVLRDVGPEAPERHRIGPHHGETDLRDRLPLERRDPGEELVENEPERPDVRARIDVLRGAHLLGRHVERRAHERPGRRHPGVARARRDLRDPEVEDLEDARAVRLPREEEVARLQIAVDDAGRVGLGEPFRRLQHVADRLFDRELAAALEGSAGGPPFRGTPSPCTACRPRGKRRR